MAKPLAVAVARPSIISVPLWGWALVALAMFALYVLFQENGALLTHDQAMYLHEVTHDARHALGVPCH